MEIGTTPRRRECIFGGETVQFVNGHFTPFAQSNVKRHGGRGGRRDSSTGTDAKMSYAHSRPYVVGNAADNVRIFEDGGRGDSR